MVQLTFTADDLLLRVRCLVGDIGTLEDAVTSGYVTLDTVQRVAEAEARTLAAVRGQVSPATLRRWAADLEAYYRYLLPLHPQGIAASLPHDL